MVKRVFQIGYFDPALSDTLIALIPKSEPPKLTKTLDRCL